MSGTASFLTQNCKLTLQNGKNIFQYILNNDYRILGLLYLPCNTFKRSGTGVNTSIWIIQRTTQKINEIFIKNINEIGYVLNKKNTPVKYKVDKTTGDFILDNNNNKIIVNDLINIQNPNECARAYMEPPYGWYWLK